MTLRTATLRTARMLTSNVRELTFDAGKDFVWKPGQWISLRMSLGDETTLARSYSIASTPREDCTFDLAVTRVENGPGSNWLHACQPGTSLSITEATGFFTLPDTLERPLLMVATGTGVAPIRAMLQEVQRRGNTVQTVLLFGVRTQEDILYADEFRSMASQNPWFRFEVTLSRPDDGWTSRHGYVQTHLAELTQFLKPCDVYACGLNAMIREVRRTLKEELGLTRDQIHTERYD
jgi:CDP-4-dehydro-6-deoxyglucose reductase, E3